MPVRLLLPALFCSLLAACGGGGGGGDGASSGGVTPPPPVATEWPDFVKFSSITANSNVRARGYSQEVSYDYDTAAGKVTQLGDIKTTSTGATLDAKYTTSTSVPNWMAYTSALGTRLTIDTSKGDVITQRTSLTIAATASGEAYALTPTLFNSFGWDYQTTAIWTTGAGSGKGTIGSMFAGAPTADTALPGSGNVTFAGLGIAHAIAPDGSASFGVATVFAATNFSARTIALTLSDSKLINLATGSSVASNDLNLAGNLQYDAGKNEFSGSVSTSGGSAYPQMSGTVFGKFYGPDAKEFSGNFTLSSNGRQTYLGAFGGKRP